MNTAPIILDIEASGFGRSGYPIEIGYALPDGQTWCSLIRPEPEWTHWDPSAEAVHHISQDRGPQRHRASADARLLQLTWQRLKEGERQVSESVEKNLKLSIVSNEFLPVGTHSHPRFWPMAAHA